MADDWAAHPPYPHWKTYASALRRYADDVYAKDGLPAGVAFADWFASHRQYLYRHATDRAKNRVVARQLLPLFERTPERWSAIGYLNTEKLSEDDTFEQYLAAWRRNAATADKPFIKTIAAEFRVELK